LVVTGSFILVNRVVRRQIRAQLIQNLEQSQLALQQIQKDRIRGLVAYSTIAAENSTLKAAIDTFQSERHGNPRLAGQLTRTVENEAEKLRASLKVDVLVITANDGEIITLLGVTPELVPDPLDLSRQPSILNCLSPNPVSFEEATSLWRFREKVYRLVSVPILLEDIVVGTLTSGFEINADLVRSIKANTRSDIAFFSGNGIIASTLSPGKSRSLLEAFERERTIPRASQLQQSELELEGESYLALRVPLTESANDSFVVLNSIDQAMTGIMVGIKQSLVTTGALAMLLAILAGWVLSRSFTRPLMNFVEFMHGITQTGDLKKRFYSTSPNYEVDVLARSFESMASSLEESQAQTARYHEELRQKESNEEKLRTLATRSRLDALISQVNPHFLFNALNTLGVMIDENPSEAQRLTSKLARTFRRTLQVSEKEFISLEDELTFIEDYLEIEKARFGERLQVVREVSVIDAVIPSFTLQPLIENAIKHGAAPKIGTTTIRIVVAQCDNRLKLQVTDDGMGIPDSKIRNFLENGYGLRNLIGRLSILYSSDFSWKLESKFQQGTTVSLELPARPASPPADPS